MTRTEFFSWCTIISIGALAWLAAGVPGLLCLIVGMIVSQIDVSWIEAQIPMRNPQPLAKKWKATQGEPFKPSARQRAARNSKKRATNVIQFPTAKAQNG